MTIEETIDLLTAAAAFDRRTVGRADAAAWHAAVGDLRFADCEAAVVAHYTETTDWLMPAHVRERVREIRAERLKRTEIPPPPPELLDNPVAYGAALRAAAVAIADGRDPAPAVQAVARQARRELEAS
jgi:hypothetical protein